MSDLYNVAKVLLSVLDSGENIYRHSSEHALLRAALAQQAEPVDLIPQDALFVCGQMGANVTRVTVEQQAEPVREWQGLTDDEFWLLPEARGWYPEEHYKLTRLARAVEAALKEKNK